MLPDYVDVHRRAGTAFDLLSESERNCVAAKFTALHNLTPEAWAQEGVRPAKGSVKYTRVTGDLYVFFSVLPEGRFLIEDFVRQGTLDLFRGTPHQPVPQT